MFRKEDLLLMIAAKIKKAGGYLYLTGGYVRDHVLGKAPKDLDVEIHCIQQDTLVDILSEFGDVKKQGVSFPVYTIKGVDIDFALPRTERKIGEKHADFIANVDPFMGLKKASQRRDFTINALMMDPLTGKIEDEWNGLNDLKEKTIRHINDKTFVEDPLRVLRAARFASTLGFKIHKKTISLCKTMDLSNLSKERVFGETKKALMSDKPSVYFEALKDMDQLKFFFPELNALNDVAQKDSYHLEDVWTHTMMVIDEAAKVKHCTDNPEYFMFAALMHDIGKPIESAIRKQLKSEGRESQMYDDDYRHENIGSDLAEVALRRITKEIALIKYVKDMVKNHMNIMIAFNSKSRKKKVLKYLDTSKAPKDLLIMEYCDLKGRIRPDKEAFELEVKRYEDWAKDSYVFFMEFEKAEHITGADLELLGLKPSPKFKTWLERARVLEYSGDKERALKQLSYEIRKAKGKNNGN